MAALFLQVHIIYRLLNQISKYFIQYTYIDKNGKFNESKFESYKDYLPIFDRTDYMEVRYEMDKKGGRKDTENYINNRLEFIYRNMKNYTQNKEDIVMSFKEEMYGKDKIHYNENLCKNCNQRTICAQYINNLDE